MKVVAGIFVGGAGRRMGGVAKGLLPSIEAGEPIVTKLAKSCAAAGCEVVLVGAHPAYAALPYAVVADAERDAGPLAGLVGLLRHAQQAGHARAVALACDMAFVSDRDVVLLATEPCVGILAARSPRAVGKWEPFFAAYDVAVVLPLVEALLARGERRLQALFAEAAVVPLEPSRPEALEDWDTEADVSAARARSSSSSRPS